MTKLTQERKNLAYFIALGLVLALTLPATLTWDGYLYLSSGTSLFSESFPAWYLVMKEPGYPFLVFVAHTFANLFGNTLVWLTIFQSILISFGVWLLSLVFQKALLLSNRTTLMLGSFSLMLFIGFASAVMQTSLVFFVISCAISLVNIPPKKWKTAWTLLGALSILCGIAISIILLIASFLLLLFNKNRLQFVKQLGLLVLGISLIAIPWFSYTASLDLSKQKVLTCRTSFCLQGFDPGISQREKFEEMVTSLPSLLFLNKESYYGVGAKSRLAQEVTTYGIPVFTGADNCLRLGPGPTYLTDRIAPLANHYCVPTEILLLRSWLNYGLFWLFPLFGLVFVYWCFALIAGRSLISSNILIIPIALVLGYAGARGGISRYNVIVQTMGPFLIYGLYLQHVRSKVKIE